MRDRLSTIFIIGKKRITETVISPALYLVMSGALVLGYFVIGEFVNSIGADGIDLGGSSVFGMLFNFLSGVFGYDQVDLIFSEGPYLFALYTAYFPLMLYLAISSVFKFGHEKSAGALELVTCGPADGTSCFMGSVVRDLLFSIIYLVIILVLFAVSSLLTNLALGGMFFQALITLIFFSAVIYAYGALASVIAESSFSGAGIFLGFILLFVLIQISSVSVVGGVFANLGGFLSWIFQWISPFFYFNIGTAQPFSLLQWGGGCLLLAGLFCAVIYAAVKVLGFKGVRA